MFSGNPVVQIWQPCWPDTFQNISNRFLVPENIGKDTKIMFLGQLDQKLCCKTAKIDIFYSIAKKNWKNFFSAKTKNCIFYTPSRWCMHNNKSLPILVSPGQLETLLMSKILKMSILAVFSVFLIKKNEIFFQKILGL